MDEKIREKYESKLVSLEEAAASIKDGDRIMSANSSSQPIDLLYAIGRRWRELNGVKVIGSFFAGDYDFFKEEALGHIGAISCFMGVKEREYYYKNRITDNIEVYTYDFSRTDEAMTNVFKPNVFVCEVAEPDDNGNFSLGVIGSMYGRAAADYADRIILQVNKSVPYLYGGEKAFVNIDEVDMICESDSEIFPIPMLEPSKTEKAIASHILPYVTDGCTLQLGVGGISNAIGFSLDDRQHLGVHTEVFVDSMMYLTDKGVIDNSMKKVMPGKSLTSFVMGSRDLYSWADHNESIHIEPVSYVTSPGLVSQLDNFISINNCMNADLTGQVGSESIGLKQYSSQGGQVAFVSGASLAKNGKSFLCMKSVNRKKDGTVTSTIDLGLPYGTAVTTPRHVVDCIVTEWGCAELKYKTLNERAMEMIRIAHPDFRQKLYDEALANHIIYKHQVL